MIKTVLLALGLLLPVGAAFAETPEQACKQMGYKKHSAEFKSCVQQLSAPAQQGNAGQMQGTVVTKGHSSITTTSKSSSFTVTTGEGSTQPPPKFDRNGNPNYDENGNYIGGHGLGTLVDSPDGDSSAQPVQTGAGGPDVSDLVKQDQANIDNSICAEMQATDPNAVCP